MKTDNLMQLRKQSAALCEYIDHGNCKPRRVKRYWRRTFMCIAQHLGFSKPTQKILWKNLVLKDWKYLSETDTEQTRTADEWLQKLCDDVLRHGDQWSLSRLTRCHRMYKQYMWATLS